MQLGEKLREARESKGLSLYDVQEKTKIQKRYLEAIEKGNFSVLPGSFYTRAFIREFALVVGLDPTQLLEEHKEELPSTADEDFERLSRVQKHRKGSSSSGNSAIFSVIPKVLTAVLIIGVIAVVWYSLQKDGDPDNVEPIEDPDKVELQRGNEALENEANAEENDKETEEAPGTDEGEDMEEAEEEVPEMEIKLVDQKDQGTPTSTFEISNIQDKVTLKLETENNSWLDVSADGEKIYSANFSSGNSPQTFDITENSEVILNIGRAVDLTITVNDQKIEYPFDATKAENYHQYVHLKLVK
jgi:cytoskeletal protein RodZ